MSEQLNGSDNISGIKTDLIVYKSLLLFFFYSREKRIEWIKLKSTLNYSSEGHV